MTFTNKPTTEPRNAPLNSTQFDPHTEWRNYGDFNPERHGGLFIRWDTDNTHWEVVHTQHSRSLNDDRTEEDQLVRTLRIKPSLIWEDPTNSKTDYTAIGAEVNEQLWRSKGPVNRQTLDTITQRFITHLATHATEDRSDRLDLTDNHASGPYDTILSSYGVNTDAITAFNNSTTEN
ncbi:hypothetical protein [environmental halophage 1 AAJ-2005]|nr:hypothetical protein [environmental halophage 1 AAJ-2005]